jgi:hypothetical protein
MFFPIPKQAAINNKEKPFRMNFQMFCSNSLIDNQVADFSG